MADPGAGVGAVAKAPEGFQPSSSRPVGEQAITTSERVSGVEVAPAVPEAGSGPRRQILDLVVAYGDAFAVAEELPLFVSMRTRQRHPWLRWTFGWRPRWLLRTFLVHHMIGVLDALERCYHRRAAVGTADAQDVADREVVDHFRRSLPVLHGGRLVALLLISVLVVSQLALAPLLDMADESETEGVTGDSDGGVTDGAGDATGGSEAGRDSALECRALPDSCPKDRTRQEVIKEQVSKAAKALNVTSLSTLIGESLSTATLDVGSSRQLLRTLLDAGPKTFVILVGYLAFVLYLVLRPLVPSFRLKRVLFNLNPDADGYLGRTSASWHVPRSTGTFRLEAAAFHELGQRSPPMEKPFDLGVLALPAFSMAAGATALAVVAGNWVSGHSVAREVHVLGIASAAGAGAVLAAPFVARLVWLWGVSRQRRSLSADVDPWGERVLLGSSKVVLIRRPAHLAFVAAVPYTVLGARLAYESAWVLRLDTPTSGYELLWLLFYSLPMLVVVSLLVMALSLPWWYRVTKELRDLGVAKAQRLGRWPALAVCLAWVTPPLGWIYLMIATVRRIRLAQRLLRLPTSRALLWSLPVGMLLPPLLISQLQAQLNSVWRAASRPSPEDAPLSPIEPSTPNRTTSGSRRRRIGVLAAAVGLVVFTVAAVAPADNRKGDDTELDALWDACAEGNGDSCTRLSTMAPSGSRYLTFSLKGLRDACADGNGDACLDLYWNAPRDSAYQEFARRNLPDRYGDSPRLDELWEACADGNGDACFDLYWTAPWDSAYREFAERNLPTGLEGIWYELRNILRNIW